MLAHLLSDFLPEFSTHLSIYRNRPRNFLRSAYYPLVRCGSRTVIEKASIAMAYVIVSTSSRPRSASLANGVDDNISQSVPANWARNLAYFLLFVFHRLWAQRRPGGSESEKIKMRHHPRDDDETNIR